MAKSNRESASGSRRVHIERHHQRELDKTLGTNEVSVKRWRHRIALIAHTGNLRSRFAALGVIEGCDHGLSWGQAFEKPSFD